MNLPVVMTQCPRIEHRVARFCIWSLGNTAGIVHMAFGNFVLLPQQLGDVPVGLFDRNVQFILQSCEQRVAHDAHEGGVAQRLAALFAFVQCDFPSWSALWHATHKVIRLLGALPPT